MKGPVFLLLAPFLLAMAAAVSAKQPMDASCMLCGTDSDAKENDEQAIPLRIDVTTKLSFSKLALTGNGGAHVALDPSSGSRNLDGDIIGLGGYPAAASVTISGQPGREIRIDLPREIRMLSSTGGSIIIRDIRSTAGPSPRLDANGKLDFSFGGKLEIQGSLSGSFRGRIPITVSYE